MSRATKILVVVNLVLAIVAFGSAVTFLGARDDYKAALEKANREFEGFRDATEKQIDGLNDQLGHHALNWQQRIRKVDELTAELEDVKRQLRESNFWIDEYRKRFGDVDGSKGTDGRVQNVRDSLVVISVGSKDGVRIGDIFHLRRGATYVGQIRIDKVEANKSVGVFVHDFAGDGAPPQTGDVAYTGNK